ncbi:putative nuclear membrane fusion protein Kar5 [Aspergillus tanneri]|uniref:Nuclear membrane fusion protein Kar5 n=1 Tax=Aspergillus tanneri TaxID=1220188 RepID=A0A5M9MHM9_9EURO|nr:uncharacterized protein ATNIH1004_008717 [Aspergillus tanneri]KAA8644513.1 hypothetical protein ATNIH1004_008717 [Aspergillus tanneri]
MRDDSAARGSVHQSDSLVEDVDLVTFLNSKTQQHDAIFKEAVQLLESMKSSPSCNRVAASRLVTSCQSVGGRAANIDIDMYLALEHIRSLYAARLAICELNEAGASTPPPCLPVTISPHHRKGIFGFSSKYKPEINNAETLPKELLASCLKTLESRPQWWTSYSNSRQNAVVICQAARVENEKEELLELHKSILESSIKLNSGLQEALRMAAAETAQYKAFMQAAETFKEKLVTEFDETQSRFRETFEILLRDIRLGVNSAITVVSSALGRVDDEATVLENKVLNISTEASHLQWILQTLHDEAFARNEQLRHAYRRDALTHHELSSSLQSKLETLLQVDIIKLLHNVEAFDASIEWLSERIGFILQQEMSVSEGLRNFEISLEKSQLNAYNLQKVQAEQFETFQIQSQLQENLQTNMRISQTLLDRTAATAANLQAMIDEAAARYRESSSLGGLFGTYSSWTICGLLLSILGSQNPKIAIVMLLIGAL